jgi:hypothetical protein
MDARQFDQLAKSFANGASRRRLMQGLVGGVAAAVVAQVRMPSAGAQCNWSGTFQTTLGGITMTLTEAGGQVSGTYTFTQDNAVRTGTITGLVRSDFPGYTVLDGYWREPGEGGRIWFAMPLDACSQFTGSYTGTDSAPTWTAGWDGVRSSGTGGTGGAAEGELTLFSNPGDSRVAAFTEHGQSTLLFGPKDADGIVQYISQARIDSPDGDPQKQALLDFDANGLLTRGALASGETMLFNWVSSTRAIITYQSADGSQEVQFPFDTSAPAGDGTTSGTQESAVLTQGDGQVSRLAYTGFPGAIKLHLQPRPDLLAAQDESMGNQGRIEVRCQGGALIAEPVRGWFKATNPPGELVDLSFMYVSTGIYEYVVPVKKAKMTLDQQKQQSSLNLKLAALCAGNLGMTVTGVGANAICAFLLEAPPVVAACLAIINSYRALCAVNTGRMVVTKIIDALAESVDVTAWVDDPKMGHAEVKVTATASAPIPVGVIQVAGYGGIEFIWTDPVDPDPEQGYTVTVRPGACVPSGAVLTMQVVGTDGYAPPPTTVTLSDTVTQGTLDVPGAAQGVKDTITATLSGSVTDKKTKQIVF